MAKQYAAIITSKGQALIAAAIKGGTTVSITEIAVGDGNGTTPVPNVGQTALVNETARVKLNSLTVDDGNANHVIADGVIPAETGGFWLREVGLFTDDGILLAVSALPPTYKPSAEEGATNSQRILVTVIVSDSSAVNITVDNTTVMASESYVDDKIAAHEKSRNHPDGTTKAKGFVQLSSATNSTSEILAATPKAVKTANDNADSRLKADKNLSDLTDANAAKKALNLDKVGNYAAVPTSGGDVGYLDNSAHYHIKAGAWDGVGPFAAQYTNPVAPFLIPYGYIAPQDVSSYAPIIKGVVQTKTYGYGTAVSFGAYTSGDAHFANAVINVVGDSGTSLTWFFSPDGSFGSPGGITANGNIVSANGSAIYESGGTVRVYSANNPPPQQDLSGYIRGDVCHQAGFVSQDINNPYMMYDGGTIVGIARRDWVSQNFLTSVRQASATWSGAVGGGLQVPAGCVVIGARNNGSSDVAHMGLLYAAEQVFVNGNWVTIGLA